MYLVFLLLSGWCGFPDGLSPPTANVDWMIGKKFDWALDQPVVATWQNSELRIAVEALSEQRRVPVIFDRRLDPNRSFSLVIRSEPLHDVWPQLAKLADAGVSNTGQTIYLGPSISAGKLRTLIALRQDELQKLDLKKLPNQQRQRITGKQPLHWDDLDSPRDIMQQLATARDLQIKGLDQVPHDLWGAADLPPVSLPEATTLVLIQFDLTYRLDVSGKTATLELIPIPEMVALERKWPLPRAKVEAISQAIRDELPDVMTRTTTEQLVATGTQEQLEELERIVRSMTSGTVRPKKSAAPPPLSKRRLTFQAKDAPLSAILDKMSETGIEFEYDKALLKKAGIDMDQLVAVDVKDVRPEELFEKLFQPVGLAFRINGLKVSVIAAEKSK